MTALAVPVFGSGLLDPMPSSSGVSPSAVALHSCVEDTREHLSKSVSISTLYEHSLTKLNAASASALEPGWDSYGAQSLSFGSYTQALRLIRALPTTTPVPDISIEPDGEVELCWSVGARRVMTVSVSSVGRLSYAALFGESKSYGAEFLGSEIPRPILENLQRVFGTR